ncbi:uncharacterized protein LTHEOB_8560 [Lasiodiplodia theobromae]|uniref:uncharacterized protein n=1 Tax=Lasiodiplodia theobromae TaxID=45133 RepID=UPI0015C35468|nr:uncharacterized protein LTHEOB_8560 [Lasiodiplodia theobromae]KAF4541565.1 hypothetical protein LTHEOB_8560 [Lasiodiplodia theobromae]
MMAKRILSHRSARDSGLDDDKDDPSENDKRALRSTPNPRDTFLGLPKSFFELRDQQRRQQQQQQKEQQQRKFEEYEKSLELLGYDNAALTSATMAKARSSFSALLTDAGRQFTTPNAPSVPSSSSLPRTRHIRQLERPRRDDHEFLAREQKLFGSDMHFWPARSTDATPEGRASSAASRAGALRNEDGEEVGHARARRHAIHAVQQHVEGGGGGQTRQQAGASQAQQQTTAAYSQQRVNQVQHSQNHTSSPAEGGRDGEVKDVVGPRVSSGKEEEEDH